MVLVFRVCFSHQLQVFFSRLVLRAISIWFCFLLARYFICWLFNKHKAKLCETWEQWIRKMKWRKKLLMAHTRAAATNIESSKEVRIHYHLVVGRVLAGAKLLWLHLMIPQLKYLFPQSYASVHLSECFHYGFAIVGTGFTLVRIRLQLHSSTSSKSNSHTQDVLSSVSRGMMISLCPWILEASFLLGKCGVNHSQVFLDFVVQWASCLVSTYRYPIFPAVSSVLSYVSVAVALMSTHA